MAFLSNSQRVPFFSEQWELDVALARWKEEEEEEEARTGIWSSYYVDKLNRDHFLEMGGQILRVGTFLFLGVDILVERYIF